MSDLAEFPELLMKRTISGKIQWEVVNDRMISTIINGFVVEVIVHSRLTAYIIRLRNKDGLELQHETFDTNPVYNIIHSLFTRVQRKALGVDEAIDSVLSFLRKN